MTVEDLYKNPTVRTLSLILAIVALVTMLWRSDEPETPIDAENLRGAEEPDGFVVGGQFITFNEQGNLTARFQSARVEQFEDTNLFRMEQPTATLYGAEGQVSWTGSAENGEFRQAEEIAQLSGNVLITRQTPGQQPLELSTASLTLDNKNRTLFTDDSVTISDALGITKAVGMKAWIDDRILELNAQVEGHYEPAQ